MCNLYLYVISFQVKKSWKMGFYNICDKFKSATLSFTYLKGKFHSILWIQYVGSANPFHKMPQQISILLCSYKQSKS